MKKLFHVLFLLLGISVACKAQNGLQSATFSSVTTGNRIILLNTAIVNHQLTWNVVGTVSSCTVALDSSSDGVTWSAGGVIAGQTCTSNGNSSTVNLNVNYVRVNVTAFSGTGTVTVTWTGNTALAGAGGLPATPTTPNVPFGLTVTPPSTTATWSFTGVTLTSQTGATYPLAATDRSTCVEINNAAMTLTVPDVGGVGFQFGYNGCLLNLGSAATINNTSSSKFNEFGALTATLQTTFSLGANQAAYFYSSPNNNWDVVIIGAGALSGLTNHQIPAATSATTIANGELTDEGHAAMGSVPPNSSPNNVGWKFCMQTAAYCVGTESQDEMHLVGAGGNAWFSISNATNAGGNQSGSQPDSASGMAMANGGVAGALFGKEGTCSTFTGVSGGSYLCFDNTAHELLAATNGVATTNFGMLVRRQPGAVHQTAQVASITTATLCAASAGACNVAGQYHVHFDFINTGTACTNVTAGSVGFQLTWTDTNATAHSAVQVPMITQASVTALAGTMVFVANNLSAFGSGDFNISTNGTVIQYATNYTGCTTGTGTYQLDAVVTRLQ